MDVEMDISYPSNNENNYNSNIVNSAEECRDACQQYPQCVGWSWFSPNYTPVAGKHDHTKSCLFKSKMEQKTKITGMVSGFQRESILISS